MKEISDYTQKKAGRPRSQKAHQAILSATRSLMLETGISKLRIEKVAEKAGVGKTTIYRRWKTKEDLVSEAFGSIADKVQIPNTGNKMEDLLKIAKEMIESVSQSFGVSVQKVTPIILEIISNPELMRMYQEQYILPRRQIFTHILEDSIESGQIHSDVDIDLVIDQLIGTYFYFALMGEDISTLDNRFRKAAHQLVEGIGTKDFH